MRGRGYEVTFQIAFLGLHLVYLVLGAAAVLHHARRCRRAWCGQPLGPGA